MEENVKPEGREQLRQHLEAALGKEMADLVIGTIEQFIAQEVERAFADHPRSLREAVERIGEGHERMHDALTQLTAAQARAEERLGQLIEAQVRTEERVGQFAVAVERLAEAQARTEERVGRLEAVVEQLAQAQARGEERMARLEAVVEELVHAQARMEERVGRLEEITAQLAQGQAELREAMKALAEEQVRMQKELRHLAKQVGGLSETLGADLEDLAYIVLHDVLKRELGWDVGPLERTFHRWNDRLEEINVFGRATDPARPGHVIWIVGEAKYNLTIREVDRFAKLVERARKHLIGEIFPVCFCRRARPEVQEHVRKLGLRLVFSYGRLI